MDKFSIINHAMVDGVYYTLVELSELVGFRVTRRSINALKAGGLISEKENNYKATQADLFTSTQAAETVRSGDFEVDHQGG